MLELRSLQQQLVTLQKAFDQALDQGKTLEEVRDNYLQIKALQRLIYERKMYLKREGKFQEGGS